MQINLIWLLLALFTWTVLVLKPKQVKLHIPLILVLLGGFARALQFFINGVLIYFFGVTYLNLIFGLLISTIFILSFIILPILIANKAKHGKIVYWLYFLLGYFWTAFALTYIF